MDIFERFWSKTRLLDNGCVIWIRAVNEDGYGQFRLDGATRIAHRLAWEWKYGPIPVGIEIDHTCFNHACVNVNHMRLATKKQNMENRQGANRNNSTGVRGVTARRGGYRARVMHNHVIYEGGDFHTLEEATEAAIALRLKLFTRNVVDRLTSPSERVM